MNERKQPARTCLGCRQVGEKAKFIRIVRADNKVEIDKTGKKAGRGAYICLEEKCLKNAFNGNQLARALKTKISPNELGKLKEELEEILNAKKSP